MISLLARSVAFSCLGPREIDELADLGELVAYADGETIFRAGTPCRQLYVIDRGEARVLSEGRVVARFVQGESFCDLELLARSTHREDAVAATALRVLAFPCAGADLEELLDRFPSVLTRVLSARIRDVAGEIRRINTLITARTPWIRDLETSLLYDSLTGLRNRRCLEQRMPVEHAASRRLWLALVKPDNFKAVNDGFGHAEGDRVLKVLARAIQAVLPPGAEALRYQGDEFAVIAPEIGRRRLVGWVKELRRTVLGMDCPIALTLAVGLAAGSPGGSAWPQVVARAHANMLAARAERPGGLRG